MARTQRYIGGAHHTKGVSASNRPSRLDRRAHQTNMSLDDQLCGSLIQACEAPLYAGANCLNRRLELRPGTIEEPRLVEIRLVVEASVLLPAWHHAALLRQNLPLRAFVCPDGCPRVHECIDGQTLVPAFQPYLRVNGAFERAGQCKRTDLRTARANPTPANQGLPYRAWADQYRVRDIKLGTSEAYAVIEGSGIYVLNLSTTQQPQRPR